MLSGSLRERNNTNLALIGDEQKPRVTNTWNPAKGEKKTAEPRRITSLIKGRHHQSPAHRLIVSQKPISCRRLAAFLLDTGSLYYKRPSFPHWDSFLHLRDLKTSFSGSTELARRSVHSQPSVCGALCYFLQRRPLKSRAIHSSKAVPQLRSFILIKTYSYS